MKCSKRLNTLTNPRYRRIRLLFMPGRTAPWKEIKTFLTLQTALFKLHTGFSPGRRDPGLSSGASLGKASASLLRESSADVWHDCEQ